MYTARFTRLDTEETCQAENLTLVEALRLVNMAWFACGYQAEALSACIIDQETGRTLQAWWEMDEDEEV